MPQTSPGSPEQVIYNTYIGFFNASEEKLTSCQNDIDYYVTLSFVKYEGEITFTKKVLSDFWDNFPFRIIFMGIENLYQIYIYLQMEPYMKMAFMTARSIVQAGMLPNWDDLLSIGI